MEQNILLDAFKLKPAAAIEFLKQKGFNVTWNWYDQWQDAHSKAFTVAKVTKIDILQDIKDALDDATTNGLPFQEFKKNIMPTLQKKGWWGVQEINGEKVQLGSVRRLRTIYETNTQSQFNAGRWIRQQETIATRPYGQFLVVIDGRTSDICKGLHNLVFRLDDPVFKKFYPPNHFGCRTRVRTLSNRELIREGLAVQSSEGRMVEREEMVGGEKVKVSGIRLSEEKTFWAAPGFDYNPGAIDWKPDLKKYDPEFGKLYEGDK